MISKQLFSINGTKKSNGPVIEGKSGFILYRHYALFSGEFYLTDFNGSGAGNTEMWEYSDSTTSYSAKIADFSYLSSIGTNFGTSMTACFWKRGNNYGVSAYYTDTSFPSNSRIDMCQIVPITWL